MSPRSTSINKARTVAGKAGWDAGVIRREVDARAVLEAGCYYDDAAGQRVVNFFANVLRHADTATGQIEPFALMPWQEHRLIRPLFGWKRADGTRRYRRGGIWVPKKNGKSTLAAGLELYMLTGDGEPSAEVYSAANDRGQAGIIHGHAVRMVELSPILSKRIGPKGIIRSTKTIFDHRSGSWFKALSADAPTKEGLNIHALIVDEIHAMQNRELWDTLIYGGASRRQPMMLSISTAGVYDVATIGWEQYTYARDVALGTNDSDWSFFSLIYEAPKGADWTDPKVQERANPSWGVTVKIDAIEEECREAQREPRKEGAFRRYRLNQWTQQATRWIPLEVWDANDAHPVDYETLRGRLTYGGLDLGAVSDLTAAVFLTECPHDPEALDVTARFWIPEDSLSDQRNRNRDLYQEWVRQGWMRTTPGPSTDYDFIESDILKEAQHFKLSVIGIDRLFQGAQVENHLREEGLDVVPIGQGHMGQAMPMKEFERRWLAKQIHHGANPILRWMADNAEVKADDAGNLKLAKPNNRMDPRKIDGIQALVNALDPLSREAGAPEPQFQMLILGGRNG